MAFLNPKSFRKWEVESELLEDMKRPDSPTIMVTKSKFVVPLLKKSTIDLVRVYQKCDPSFLYNPSDNPARVLTKPSEAKYNDSFDNELYNYILHVNDKLISPEGEEYLVMDSLGEGTFGQVVKCRTLKGQVFAAKVIKNKPAYYIQGLIEVKILSKLNKELDPEDKSHIVRMIDYFVFRNHLVIIFELLSLNIYEILRKNGMRGFSLPLILSFTKQMLEALCVLEKGNIIHCDMKPENVLLVNDRADIKVIDLGSACFENATIYTYIQSRYYRSPEVLLGLSYGSEIDSWSLGCICAELFIGIPLFPGSNEYDQLYRIIQLLGLPPQNMIHEGKSRDKFFLLDSNQYRLKTREEYMETQKVVLQPFRAFLDITSIDDLLYLDRKIPRDDNDIESRQPFIKFLKGLLKIDPAERWTASQAILHPFIQGKPLQEFIPIPSNSYLEVQKNRPVPTGSLRGSCPSLLQQIRGSQDLTLRAHDVCFRPLVEELQDDFFTGFVHGKLVQVQPPPMPNPSTQWNNPFMNIPISFPHNFQHKPHIAKPLPNIVGPRYDRPHSYGTGEEYSHLPRPISPMIEENKYLKKKPRKNPIKKGRSNSSKNTNEHTPKVKSEPIRPNSQDDKKIKPASDKFFPFNTSLIPDITQQTFIPEINSQNIAVKTGDTTKFLDKVRNDLNKK